jgi:hypothetical protein
MNSNKQQTMTNNKQQTAVEWQHIELMRINFEYATSKITPREFQEQTKYIFEQAKAMHKEEIIDAANKLLYHNTGPGNTAAEQYYNETYGGNK